jgi:hypothetical protein
VTEMVHENVWFCGQLTISLWILMCAWGYCLAGWASASWQTQPSFWLNCSGNG